MSFTKIAYSLGFKAAGVAQLAENKYEYLIIDHFIY
jgi:hypothetical protein